MARDKGRNRGAAGYEHGRDAVRTRINSCFLTEKSAFKLVFSVLIRAAKRWRRVSFTKTELNYLDRIREELGIMEGLQNKQELQEVC